MDLHHDAPWQGFRLMNLHPAGLWGNKVCCLLQVKGRVVDRHCWSVTLLPELPITSVLQKISVVSGGELTGRFERWQRGTQIFVAVILVCAALDGSPLS